jgi:hypothetical protein
MEESKQMSRNWNQALAVVWPAASLEADEKVEEAHEGKGERIHREHRKNEPRLERLT